MTNKGKAFVLSWLLQRNLMCTNRSVIVLSELSVIKVFRKRKKDAIAKKSLDLFNLNPIWKTIRTEKNIPTVQMRVFEIQTVNSMLLACVVAGPRTRLNHLYNSIQKVLSVYDAGNMLLTL